MASFISAVCQNKTLRRHLPDRNSGQVSRVLKRLRVHGLVQKVVAGGLKLRELVVMPHLAFGHVG
jgi:hypothetical protein